GPSFSAMRRPIRLRRARSYTTAATAASWSDIPALSKTNVSSADCRGSFRPLTICPNSKSLVASAAMTAFPRAVCAAAVALIAAGSLPAQPGRRYDVVVANGRIVDGTGSPWFRGDVAIAGDRIAALGAAGSLGGASAATT